MLSFGRQLIPIVVRSWLSIIIGYYNQILGFNLGHMHSPHTTLLCWPAILPREAKRHPSMMALQLTQKGCNR